MVTIKLNLKFRLLHAATTVWRGPCTNDGDDRERAYDTIILAVRGKHAMVGVRMLFEFMHTPSAAEEVCSSVLLALVNG